MARIAFKLSMVGENFEIYFPQIARIAFNLSTMVGENFEICYDLKCLNIVNLSTMVGETFESVWYAMFRSKLFEIRRIENR